ncbi:MAG: hypothetical protein HKP61_15110 [Dactylosporangium sp.]|nr:hypothetical protein [Dactylosporangium sp.]NNJ62240.1 hypothetical protein [Dactylosporangium sp.]
MEGYLGREEHADPTTEVGRHLAQGLAVLATLGEATARVTAEEIRRREHGEDRDEQSRQKMRRVAERSDKLSRRAAQARARETARTDRHILAQASDAEWLATARLRDLAGIWRTARLRENEFPEAPGVIRRVEDQLRQNYPRLMRSYDAAMREGVTPATAMRQAVDEFTHPPRAWAHGGRTSPGIGPGQPPVSPEAFAQANTAEQIRLATGVDIDTYVQQLHGLGAGGDAAAQALRETLATRAAQHLRDAAAEAATPDDPTTPGINEHTGVGLKQQSPDLGDVAGDQAAAASRGPMPRSAARLAGEWYPDGLDHPTPRPADLGGKRPANTMPTRTPGQTTRRTP